MELPEKVSVLLCSVPIHGHVAPMLAIARRLTAAGMPAPSLSKGSSRFCSPWQ